MSESGGNLSGFDNSSENVGDGEGCNRWRPATWKVVACLLLLLLLLGIIALALIPLYLSGGSDNGTNDQNKITNGSIQISGFCSIPVNISNTTSISSLLDNKTMESEIKNNLKLLYKEFFTELFGSNIFEVDVINLKNLNESFVKPELNVTFNQELDSDIIELLAKLNTTNIQSVMEKIDHYKYSYLFLFEEIDDCTGAFVNASICESNSTSTSCLPISCEIDINCNNEIDRISSTTTVSLSTTSNKETSKIEDLMTTEYKNLTTERETETEINKDLTTMPLTFSTIQDLSTTMFLTSKLTNNSSYEKYGYLMIENFCRIPVMDGSMGDNFIDILKENGTIIPQNNINITEEFEAIYNKIFREFLGSNFADMNVIFVRLEENNFDFYVRPYLNVSFLSQDKKLTLASLTSKLKSENIESAFKKYSSDSVLGDYIRLELIDECNGTEIKILNCDASILQCNNSYCYVDENCDETGGDSVFTRKPSTSTSTTQIPTFSSIIPIRTNSSTQILLTTSTPETSSSIDRPGRELKKLHNLKNIDHKYNLNNNKTVFNDKARSKK
ncbi:hypothetical protein BpHYR1_024294 [Brachionus plicatilis]|uniref:SEA domain-containing protein n=1 Tax=Brachionus plicatilis TaxID=10195 RepID=A0A3M7SD78_BRAPC|nr:hypothetical protein BpHYR1_024294 [Brachionus plicatilis]